MVNIDCLILIAYLLVLHAFWLSWGSWCNWTVSIILLDDFLFLAVVLIHLWIVLMDWNKLFYIGRFTTWSWRQHTSIRWSIFVFFIIIHHLRKIKTFIFLFLWNWFISTFLFNTCLRSLWTNGSLKILESKVSLNNSLYCSHVWISIDMESFNKLAYMIWALPLLYSLEETQVYNK